MDGDGFERLISTLVGMGAPDVPEGAALDSGHLLAAENVTLILSEARRHGWPFERAWSSAINRVQPSQLGGVVDVELEAQLRESRALLEEQRPQYQAAYERRSPTTRERAVSIAAAWRRLDAAA